MSKNWTTSCQLQIIECQEYYNTSTEEAMRRGSIAARKQILQTGVDAIITTAKARLVLLLALDLFKM